jgi:hypothetical protein
MQTRMSKELCWEMPADGKLQLVNVSQRYDQLMKRVEQKHLEGMSRAADSMKSLRETLERMRAARLASEERIRNLTLSLSAGLPSHGASTFRGVGGGGEQQAKKEDGGAGGGSGGDQSVMEHHVDHVDANGEDGDARTDAPPSPMLGNPEGGGSGDQDDADAHEEVDA